MLSLRKMRDRKSSEEALVKKDPKGKSLARDLWRSTLGEVGTRMSAGEVHTVSPLRMGAEATPLRLTAMTNHDTDTT